MGSATGELIGRQSELDAIRAALRDRSGTHLLVIEGAPGIGKTRLLGAVADVAAAGGARVLSARASELERELPFGVMRQLFEPVLARAPSAQRLELLGGSAAFASHALTAHPHEAAADVFAVLNGLYWLTANLATITPLVLCIDDLHWADEPSLRALAYLLARVEGVDAQLCVALRPNEPGTDAALIAAAIGTGNRSVVRPAPLEAEAAATIVRARLGERADDVFCGACHAATGGNPLLLFELAHELADVGVAPTSDQAGRVDTVIPSGIAPAVLRRVERLASDAPAVARALAILGDGAEAGHVAALTGLGRAHTNAVLEALVRAEVLESAAPPAFAHPLVRSAIAASVDASDRARLHRDAARLLAADGIGAERLAAHLLEAPPAGDGWVVQTLRTAAAETAARGAPDLAARFLRRALDEPPVAEQQPDVLLATGQAEAQAGDERAIPHLRHAVETATDPETLAHGALTLIPLLGIAGQVRMGIDLALETLERLNGDHDMRLRVEAELLNLTNLDTALRPFGIERQARLDPAKLGGGTGASMILALLANAALARGESRDEAVDLAERALAGGRLLGSMFMYAHAAAALVICGRYAQSIAVWNDFIAHAHARGDAPGVALAHAFRASANWHAGALAETLADVEIALDVGPRHGFALAGGIALAFRVEAHVVRGELDEARAALALTPDPGEQLPDILLLSARGRVRLAEGRLREALEDMRTVGRLQERWRTANSALAPWRAEAALALAGLGDNAAAQRLIAVEVQAARRWGDPWLLGQALRAQALIGPAQNRRRRLADTVELLRPSEARLELAFALAELGADERAAGRDVQAREAAREALELATRCDAPALAERARAVLIAAGGRPRRALATGPEALTPTEQRVARIAATGAPNREIAQSLFVTEKTIEAHLAAAYRKLGIRARGELGTALAPD